MSDFDLPIRGDAVKQWLKLDCRRYRGDRPCAAGVQGVCPASCEHYAPMGHRILIIKLAALGDVLRTAALLPGLKERWPTSHITWVTRPNAVRMLGNHPLIDRLLPFDAETICHLEHERFDLCLSLDKEPGPTALAMRVDARERRGMGLSPQGTTFPLNAAAVDYFLLGLDDHKKFVENTKSCQQLIYEALGLEYSGQRYRIYPGEEPCRRAGAFWSAAGVTDRDVLVGFNTGAGRVFANKTWPVDKFIELADTLERETSWRVALFGGPDERTVNARIAGACPTVIAAGCDHDEPSFAALLQRCDVLVTGDTMALHVAIAADVPCVVLFGPTCRQEIDLYGRGEKMHSSRPCSPCYARRCDKSPTCMDDISVEQVRKAVERWACRRSPSIEPSPPLVCQVT